MWAELQTEDNHHHAEGVEEVELQAETIALIGFYHDSLKGSFGIRVLGFKGLLAIYTFKGFYKGSFRRDLEFPGRGDQEPEGFPLGFRVYRA